MWKTTCMWDRGAILDMCLNLTTVSWTHDFPESMWPLGSREAPFSMWPKVGLNGPLEPYSHFNLVCQCLTTIYFYDEMLIMNDKISSLTWQPLVCVGPIGELGTPNHPDKKLLHRRSESSSAMLPEHRHRHVGLTYLLLQQDPMVSPRCRPEGEIFSSQPMFFFWPHKELLTKKMMDLNWYGRKRKKKTLLY